VYGPDTLFTCRPFASWRPVKDAAKQLHTLSSSFVSTRALNAKLTFLGLGTHDFA
jgi:hypothetical protein